MKEINGLCVGGPLDGQRYTTQANYFEVAERPPVRLSRKVSQPDLIVSRTTFLYSHHSISPSFGLWLPQGVTLEDAARQMVEAIGMTALASRYEQIMARRKDDAR